MLRKTEPFEHLRKRRHPANTYLNELTRAEYRRLFQKHFDIIEERVTRPNLGRQYLTDEVRKELSSYSEDELFSNQVLFVLKVRQVDGSFT